MDLRLQTAQIRKLRPTEYTLLTEHLLRLDARSRKLRFGAEASDRHVANYGSGIQPSDAVIYGCILNGDILAASELRRAGGRLRATAEAAFSVESEWQDHGIGSALLVHIIRAARNRGFRRIIMNCLPENRRMQHIARKHEAELRFDRDQVVGELTRGPNLFSLWREDVEDRMGLVLGVLELNRTGERRTE